MEEKYVRLNLKARQDKKIYSKEQISAPDFKSDYGRIVSPGYIVFDFDEQPYINIISKIIKKSTLKCKLLTTDRGVHFMFKTNQPKVPDAIKRFNWIGLKCDVKACGTQEYKESYQALRVNGKDRIETYINGATNDDELSFAPKWLYPINHKKNDIDLTEEQEGNRNNLFYTILKIRAKKNGFTYEEYVEQAHLINNYVLPTPLSEEELNNAIRQEDWDSLEFGEEKQLLLNMAQDVIEFWNCLWTNEHISFFNHNENRYDTNEIILKGYLQEKYKYENITTYKMKEVLEQVSIQLQNNINYWKERNSEYILCGNHLVSTIKDEVIPNTRTIYTDIYYPYSIMSKEEFENFDGRAKSFIQEISCYDQNKNPDIIRIIWECIGCMLAPTKPFGKIFILYGTGANGKSLLLKIIKKIMGDLMTHANILSINDKFGLESVINGIANVTDDIGITTLRETGRLKSILDGGTIDITRKHKSTIWWKPNSQFVICCNEIPKIVDTTRGMIRRLAFIPFELQLQDNEIDITLEQTLTEDIDNLRYIMTGGIFAYREALKRGTLTEIAKQKELERDFIEENQTAIDLFYDYLLQTEGNGNKEKLYRYLNGKTTEELYEEYKEFRAPEKNIEIQKTFSRRFRKKLPTKIELVGHCLNGYTFKTYTLKQ